MMYAKLTTDSLLAILRAGETSRRHYLRLGQGKQHLKSSADSRRLSRDSQKPSSVHPLGVITKRSYGISSTTPKYPSTTMQTETRLSSSALTSPTIPPARADSKCKRSKN